MIKHSLKEDLIHLSIDKMDFSWYLGLPAMTRDVLVAGVYKPNLNNPRLFQNGDVYRIWRNNGNVEFYVNGLLDGTFPDKYPDRPMYLEAVFYDVNKKVENLYIYKEVLKTHDTIQTTEMVAKVDGYKRGFNGQEKDDQVSGKGNSYTAEFWQYDSRLGRRWNVDPKPNVSISRYATFANNPIVFSDLYDDTIRIRGTVANENGKVMTYTMRDGKFFDNSGNKYESGSDSYVDKVITAINEIKNSSEEGCRLIYSVNSHKSSTFIKYLEKETQVKGNTILMDLNEKVEVHTEEGKQIMPNWLVLAHELAHSESRMYGFANYSIWITKSAIDNLGDNVLEDEKYASHIENKIRAQVGLPLRTHYISSNESNYSFVQSRILYSGGLSRFYFDSRIQVFIPGSIFMSKLKIDITPNYDYRKHASE